MGAIKLATSTTTDEEYGGTFPLDASDIPYDANTTVKQAIDETVNSLTTKVDYLALGNVGGTGVSDALGKAWDAITIYNKPIIVSYLYNGFWMGMALKYPGGTYGMMQSMPYHTGNIYLLNVDNGTKTFKALTGQ